MKTPALALLSIFAFAFGGLPVSAQTSGTLTTQTNQDWQTAPWVITSGPGTFPDGGGVATLGTHVNTTIGTVATDATITLTAPITLSGITWNTPFSMTIAGSAANNLSLSAGGAIFDVPLSPANTPSIVQTTNRITAPITGGGSFGLTKTGNGSMTLAANSAGGNTYTGGTHINAGTLSIVGISGAAADAVLGATGAGNGVSFDGGTLSFDGWTTSRNILINSGGATLYSTFFAGLHGIISGNGNFTMSATAIPLQSGAFFSLSGANTYTGSTFTGARTEVFIAGPNGSINQSAAYDFAGIIGLLNAGAGGGNNNDRLSDTAPITSRGATITLDGNAMVATTENAGALSLVSGLNTITVTPNAARPASFNFASITRQNNATLFVRGTNLGAAPANGVAQITSALSPGTLIGGGGLAGSTNISILPWAVGNTSATGLNNSSLVTWDAASGAFRPLATSEYTPLSSGLSTTDNTRVTAATAINAATTVNSVVVAGGDTLLTGTGGLNITSGALLYTPGSGSTGTISANVNFGSAEGIITNSAPNFLTMSGVISGSNGLTLNSLTVGSIRLTGANTYTGQTTLLGGEVIYSGLVANDGVTPGAFGLSTSALVLNPGTSILSLLAISGPSTINRDIVVQSNDSGVAQIGAFAPVFDVTINGNVNLQSNSTLQLRGPIVVNGNITGSGMVTDGEDATIFLNGNNSYSGGTDLRTGTYVVGSDTAFGTGTIYFSNDANNTSPSIRTDNSTAHTIANNIVLAGDARFAGIGALTLSGGLNLNGTRTIVAGNTAGVTVTGVVSNGALTKTGPYLVALNNTTGNTYTGGTVLGANAGTLNVNNTSGSGTGSGTVLIGGTTSSDRSTLSGNFIISGATRISGALNPGNSVGTANFGSTLSLTSNALVTMELGSSVSADDLNVAGLLTLGGSTFNIITIGGYQATVGTVFDLVDWGSLNGTATVNVTGAALADPGGTFWDTSSFLTDGTIRVAAVPEPGALSLCFAGGLSLLVLYWRSRSRRGSLKS